MTAAMSNSLILSKNPPFHLSSAPLLKPSDHCLVNAGTTNLSFSPNRLGKLQLSTSKRQLTVQAGYSDGDRTSSGSIFVGGFVLGGIIVGTLGCVYAPQISKALAAAADSKDLMKKLPKFIYDEEKALEKTRKILSQKIEQLNSAIDNVSGQLRSKDDTNGAVIDAADEVEAAYEDDPTYTMI